MQEIIRNNPFVRIIVPFILGIISGFKFNAFNEIWVFYALFFSVLFLSLLLLINQSRFLKRVLNYLLVFIFYVLGIHQVLINQIDPTEFNKKEVIVGQILDYPDSTVNSLKLNCRLTQKVTDSINEPLKGNAIVYLRENDKTKALMPGCYIAFKARPEPISNLGNPSEFDYKSWAANNGYYYRFFLKDNDWFIYQNQVDFSVLFELKKLRRSILNHYKSVGISKEELSVFTALTLGDKTMLGEELREGFAAAGLMHVLAVSGLHVGIIYLVVRLMCGVLLKLKYGKVLRFLISIIVLWGYATLTGLSPSVTRAATMFSVFVLGDLLGRRYAVYNSIGLAAFVLLFYDPNLIHNVGFQMSFLAVIGIVAFYPIIYKWLYVPNKWLDKVWQLIAVSIAAQLITTPLSLYYFNQFPLLFLMANILMIPLVTLLMYLFILLVITIPLPVVSSKIGWCASGLTEIMNGFANWVNSLDWAIYRLGGVTVYHVVLLYMLLGIITYFGFRTTYKYFRLTILALILFVGFDSIRTYYLQKENRFVVFNTYEQPLWLLTSGDKYALGDPNLDPQSARYIEPVLQDYDIRTKEEKQIELADNIAYFGKEEFVGLYYNSDYYPQNDMLHCRWLILSESTPGDIRKLISKINAMYIIADATVPNYKLKDWRSMLKNTGQKIYSVNENGAFFETWSSFNR